MFVLVFVLVGISAGLLQLPGYLLRPLNPGYDSSEQWQPWYVLAAVAVGTFLIVALSRESKFLYRRLYTVAVLVWIVATIVGAGVLRQMVLDRPANYQSAVFGNTGTSGGDCAFPSSNGRLEVYLLRGGRDKWQIGQQVPVAASDGAPDASLYLSSYEVEWDDGTVGGGAVFGSSDDYGFGSDEIRTAAGRFDLTGGLCAHTDFGSGDSSTWAEAPRSGLFSQARYLLSPVCHQVLPVLKTQIFATTSDECELEREFATARLANDSDYSIYR